MTKAQRYTLLIDHREHVSLWTLACRANGWPKSDREFRMEKISEIMGREITSTTDLNNTTDVTRLFTFLRAQADDLTAAVAMQTPGFERAPQLKYKIAEVESELTAWPASDPMGADGVRRLVRSLCADIANEGTSPRVEICDVEDLTAEPIELTRAGNRRKIDSQLDQLLVTLTRMLSKFKKDGRAARVPSERVHFAPVAAPKDPDWTV